MLIYDKPLLSGQPPLSGHLPVLRGWPLNGGCIFLDINAWRIFEVPPTPLKTTNGLFTFFVWLIVNKRNRPQTKKTHNNNKKTKQQQKQNHQIPFYFTLLNWTLQRGERTHHVWDVFQKFNWKQFPIYKSFAYDDWRFHHNFFFNLKNYLTYLFLFSKRLYTLNTWENETYNFIIDYSKENNLFKCKLTDKPPVNGHPRDHSLVTIRFCCSCC